MAETLGVFQGTKNYHSNLGVVVTVPEILADGIAHFRVAERLETGSEIKGMRARLSACQSNMDASDTRVENAAGEDFSKYKVDGLKKYLKEHGIQLSDIG